MSQMNHMNAIVTGASRGIGKAIAYRFAKEGFNLALCARNQATLDALKSELEETFPTISVHVFSCDVSIKDEIENFARFAVQSLGSIDVLVNNAGTFLPGNVHDEASGQLETLINTNLYSAYYLSRAIVPTMIERRSGMIFNMCSIASIQAYANGGSYGISKHALLGMSRSLRDELKEFGIRVTSILPGAVLTDSWSGVDLPESRFIRPEDIADTVYSAYALSSSATIEELVIRPTPGDI